ncbi:Thermophilic serine proteinase precursor [Planctomycetes bacterium Pan216]|uniref:Thermophilic serine proteinase n=1 Tax=Kolteria novifilia TaxID=2527975 RepID=A0A518BD75_9BACT|nr:Thermophilic serine proteinase precursor [Planctomycetes bacterium Pan216]
MKPPLLRAWTRVLHFDLLEDRIVPTSSPLPTELSHSEWRNLTFTIDDTEVAAPSADDNLVTADTQATNLIGLPSAQANYPYRGTGYSIAVIDSGIDYTHPAFLGPGGSRVIAGYDFFNDDADPMDDNGHGTHVAGIVASSNANFPGVAPDANLIALKALGANGSGSFGDIEDALRWVAENQERYNIVAVNMSLGSGSFLSNPYFFFEDEFSILRSQGVFVAAASGNGFYNVGSSIGIAYPSISPQVVSVGAVWDANVGSVGFTSGAQDFTTGPDLITSFTQRSADLDLLAPGAAITSADLGGTYATRAGTSMASPVVAGAAAILHQALDAAGLGGLAHQDFMLSLFQDRGVSVFDGDDENDNVINTGLTFSRLDLAAALDAVATLSGAPPVNVTEINVGVYRNATFSIDANANGIWDGGDVEFGFGLTNDQPIIGSIDGESYWGVFRGGEFIFDANRTMGWDAGDLSLPFGVAGDIAITGVWSAGAGEYLGIFRDGSFILDANGDGVFGVDDQIVNFGTVGDLPIVADVDGDGVDELGIVRGNEWYIDLDRNAIFDTRDLYLRLGGPGAEPVVVDGPTGEADYLGVFEGGVWSFDTNRDGLLDGRDQQLIFGLAGDAPVASDWMVNAPTTSEVLFAPLSQQSLATMVADPEQEEEEIREEMFLSDSEERMDDDDLDDEAVIRLIALNRFANLGGGSGFQGGAANPIFYRPAVRDSLDETGLGDRLSSFEVPEASGRRSDPRANAGGQSLFEPGDDELEADAEPMTEEELLRVLRQRWQELIDWIHTMREPDGDQAESNSRESQ